MPSEIPVEAWEYRLLDAVRSLAGTLRTEPSRDSFELPGLADCVPVRSARAGLILAIQALGLCPGASVAVPLYCCPVVLKAVRHAGCTPLFVDIDPTNYCMAADDLSGKATRADAAIAVHMFGHTCDMNALRAALKGKPIIEDCAQALGSRLGGQSVGASADIAVFSFRSGKYISAGEGGVIYSADERHRSEVRKVVSGLPVPSLADECLHVLATYTRSKLRSKPLWGMVGRRLWAEYNSRVEFTRKSAIAVTQPFRSDLVLARRRMTSINRLVEMQRANALHYLQSLDLRPDMCVREACGDYFNRYSFPIRCASREDRDRLRAHLRRQRITTSTPYCELLDEAARHYGYAGDCRESERAFERTLVIPSHYRLTRRESDHIVKSVNEGLSGAIPPEL